MDTRSNRNLETVRPGDHLCMFYENRAEQVAIAATYLRLGLVDGQKCICIAADPSAKGIAQALEADGVDVTERLRCGALSFLTGEDIGGPGAFDSDHTVSFWERAAAEAASTGFTGLRVAGDMIGFLGTGTDPRQMISYELLLAAFCRDRKAISLCQYNLTRFPPEIAEELLGIHTTIVAGSEACPNPYYEPDDTVDRQGTAGRVRWKLAQIEKAYRAARIAQTANAMLTLELDRHRKTQRELAKQHRIESIMSETARTLSSIQDRAALFDAACRIAVNTAGLQIAWIDLIDPDSGRATAVSQCGADDLFLAAITSSRSEITAHGERADGSGSPITTSHYDDLEDGEPNLPYREELLARGVRSAVSLPLRVQSTVVAVLSVCSPEPNHFDRAEIGWLTAMAADLSTALDALEAQRQRMQAEDALRKSEQRYHTLFDNAADGMIIHDLDGCILEVNRAYCERLECSREELLGKQLGDILTLENAALLASRMAAIVEHGHAVFDSIQVSRNGDLIPVEVNSRLIDYEGKSAVISVSRDITERLQIEEQLRRAQRLETAGRVAGQVAHDFNNLLGPMAAYPELIKMMLPAEHEAVRLCDDMLLAARNMADINTDMLALSRRGLLNQEPVDINSVIRQALEQIPHQLGHIGVATDLPRDLALVSGSHAQLLRVILNLINNACDAMDQGGTLRIKTSNTRVDEPIGKFNRVEPGEYVQVTIRDDGCGIPAGIRDRIFDAFFTTKSATGRRGSGLGLTVVQALVQDHRGYVDLESEEGKGTTFNVYLPTQTPKAYTQERMRLDTGIGIVLVVDDDAIQRQVLDDLLTKLGYRVERAASGEEAVDFLRDHPVDLLILDMVMPDGIDGAETYRRVAAMWPGQKAIILSGFAETDRVEEAQRLGAGTYLRKPMSLQQLAKAVREELDR